MLDRTQKPRLDCSVTDDGHKVDRDPQDFYPTPAFVPLSLLDNECFEGDIWDPCCGDGEMILALKTRLHNTNPFIASDLHDHGFGHTGHDFLKVDVTTPVVDNIITNFPYRLIDEMMPHALAATRRKVASFARLGLLAGGKRRAFFNRNPPQRIYVYSERVTIYSRRTQVAYLLSGKTEKSATTDSAWYVWDKSSSDHMKLILLPPGRKHEYGDITRRLRSELIQRAARRMAT